MAAPTTDPGTTTPGPPRSPYANRWWIASAIVVALVALLGLLLLVIPHGSAGPSISTAPLRAPVTSACGLPTGGEQTPPQVTPPTSWRLVGTMAAPTDPAVGPGTTVAGVPACYAPTPLGALYAAVNFLAAVSSAPTRAAAVTALCAPSPGRDALLTGLTASGPGDTSTGVQVAGFYVVGYRPAASASLLLALRGQGGLGQLPLSLVWSDGTWLVQLPPTGSPFDAVTALPSLGRFVAWQGA